MPESTASLMEQIVSLCKRRGFIYQASEIYGGLTGFWDYGPLGTLLKNNIRDSWWRDMVITPPLDPDGHPVQMVGLDSAIIQHPKTWVASGHATNFNDPMVDCTETKKRYRADHINVAHCFAEKGGNQRELGWISAVADGDEAREMIAARAKKLVKKTGGGEFTCPEGGTLTPYTKLPPDVQKKVIGPDTDTPGTLTEPRLFNMMFETYVGAIRNEESKAYLRPETAQGIFLDYKNILDTMRVKVPFGVAQIGKSYRNEVTPRNFIFRSREFEQMEMEFFCHPDEAAKWYEFWKDQRMKWWVSLGVNPSNLRMREHDKEELAFYSKMTVDIDYKWPFTAPDFGELEGIAHRGCYDLTQHQTHSGQKMDYFDQERKEKGEPEEKHRYIPNVIEPAAGLSRAVLLLLCESYTSDKERPSGLYMKFTPAMAPIKAGIFPLVNKEGMPDIAEKLYLDVRQHFTCEYDAKQSIGKRYARNDEIGTPFCFTIDGQTLQDRTVTVRERDTASQQRINIDQVKSFIGEKLAARG